MDVNGHPDLRHFVVLDLAKTDLFISFDWIRHHNPNIDWVEQTLTFDRCPNNCDRAGEALPPIAFHQMYLRGVSMDISREAAKLQPKRTLDEQLPDWLKDFKDIFEPQSFDQLPPHRPGFDHEIKLKPDAPPISPQKVYPLSPAQRQLVREFLDENLGFVPCNLHTQPPSSSSPNKMEKNDPHKIIDGSTLGLS